METQKKELSVLLKTFSIEENIGDLLILKSKHKKEENQKKCLFDPKMGIFLIQPVYRQVGRLFDHDDEDLYDVSNGEKEGVFNIKTQKFALPLEYRNRWHISGPLHLVSTSKGAFGVFNLDTGKMFIKPQFDDIDNWQGSYHIVRKGKRKGILDMNSGKLVTEIEYTEVYEIDRPYFQLFKGKRSRIFNTKTGKLVTGWLKSGPNSAEHQGSYLYRIGNDRQGILFDVKTGNMYVQR